LAARQRNGFTLAELLVSMGVLVLLVLIVSTLVNNASTLTTAHGKQISTDTQARVVFDRMALDFAQIIKRTDVDYYLKTDCPECYPGHSYGHSQGHGQRGQSSNDQIAFFTQVPGYYAAGPQSPSSLVSYRVNSLSSSSYSSPYYNKLQRMAVGLLWNGYSNGNYHQAGYTCPMFFLPPSYFFPYPNMPKTGSGAYIGAQWAWPNSIVSNVEDPSYETIGPGVFRFEYYYLLKDGHLSQNPFLNNADQNLPHYRDVNGLNDVEAIVVSIAVVDSRSRSLLNQGDTTEINLLNLAALMWDFSTVNQHLPPRQTYVIANDVENQWNCVLTNGAADGCGGSNSGNWCVNGTCSTTLAAMPQLALQGIRVYTRYFDLNNL
jgi:prepilin-type N-terminal cleavage/methylation domain-containing protein